MTAGVGLALVLLSNFCVLTMGTATLNGKSIDELLESGEFKNSLKDAEQVLTYVNKNFISLNDNDRASNAEHLKAVLTKIVKLMKDSNALFNKLYVRHHFAGSYPDGLKIGKPEEYDMNLVFKTPVDVSKLEFVYETPSFIMMKMKTNDFPSNSICGSDPSSELLKCQKWFDDENFFLQTKFREWMESVITKAFQGLPSDEDSKGNTKLLKVEAQDGGEQYKIQYRKSGPALTLKVQTPDNLSIDVDLVAAFEFGPAMWPSSVLPLPKNSKKKFWMAIPKPKKLKEGHSPGSNDSREWRMSFLDQEREILSDTGTVKPTIKLLKKLRDTTNLKVSSYAIKTVIMHELKKQQSDFWKNRLAYIFLYMLNRLAEEIKHGHIPFYWDERDNLLKLEKKTYENVSNRLFNILKDIVKDVGNNPFAIAEKLLTKEECSDLKVKYKCIISPRSENVEDAKQAKMLTMEVNGLQSDNNSLSKIMEKLNEIHQQQITLSTQISNTQKECMKKITEVEEHLANLSDTVKLLRCEIKNLQTG